MKPLNQKNKSSGQAAVEMVFALGVAILFVKFTLAAAYFHWALWVLDHAHYENLICLQTLHAKNCEQEFKDQTKLALLGGEFSHEKDRFHAGSIERNYRFTFFGFTMHEKLVVTAPR